ncbi:MAG: lysine--tRNA ligase [Kiritimatiellaeota bacterium]|nr:lysine--tRNA ligase [Kiritimatiellota bacterium]
MSDPSEHTATDYREQRAANMQKLAAAGHAPFGQRFDRTGRLADIRAAFEEGREVAVAGRLMSVRGMGKAVFADLRDGSDRFQIFIKADHLSPESFANFKLLDLGDWIGVTGKLFTTRTGEQSIAISDWRLLSKCLHPLPEKWHGLKDEDECYRKRYLDLLINPAHRRVFDLRAAMIREIRAWLAGRGFQEVETPMMHNQAGGAAAKPFTTHYNALDTDMFMRIAPELFLKRLLVGGFDKVFEINRNFRNEGLDRTHSPEFTALEIYEAFGDLRSMKDLIEGLLPHLAQNVFGVEKINCLMNDGETREVNLMPPYREATYHSLVCERMGADWPELPLVAKRQRCHDAGLHVDPKWDDLLVTHEVYEKLIEKNIVNPTFVTRLPRQLVPLAKACDDNPDLVDVFELVIAGREVAPAYSELNDPFAQRARLADQALEDPEKMDEDFLLALEHGMPPAGGMGVGIDRLVMLLAGCDSIRDVILFPHLKKLRGENQ